MRGLRGIVGVVCSLFLASVAACRLPGTTAVDSTAAYTPSWISASWDAGYGPPALRFNRDAPLHPDAICPAYSIGFRLSSGRDSLTVISGCDTPATFYLCATNGYPGGAVPQCAADPLATPAASLTVTAIPAGGRWTDAPADSGLSVEVFYCGERSTMAFAPLRCGR